MKFIFLLSFCVVLLSISKSEAQTQYKLEREIGISEENVPEKALLTISGIDFSNAKKHWYKEWSLTAISYELKVKIDNKKFSIEFDSLGNLEDIERSVKFTMLPSGPKEKIINYLEKNFKKFKIQKSDLQWLGLNVTSQQIISADNIAIDNFELIIKANKNGKFSQFELLFDSAGNFKNEKEIIHQINNDNLEY